MLIVADENIPFVTEAFGHLGEVRTLPGRRMRPGDLREAELLLVRSVTRVNAALLDDSAVRFVASATIGKDHLDTHWLEAAGIGWTTAPGCNARAVAEWVAAALLMVCARNGLDHRQLRAGIVGRGNVGQQVRQMLTAMGIECLVNDPPLAESGVEDDFSSLNEILDCGLVCLHTPLTLSGPHATRHLIGADQLARLRRGSLLFNAGRGEVVDSAALSEHLAAGRLHAALDVWENEPQIDPALLALVEVGTPHVAGYSYDGRVRGTEMIYRAACEHLGVTPQWQGLATLPAPETTELNLHGQDDALAVAVQHACDLSRDDAELRAIAGLAPDVRGPYFDNLRKHYRQRREFARYQLANAPLELRDSLVGMGFSLAD